jgi:hypothetical protein
MSVGEREQSLVIAVRSVKDRDNEQSRRRYVLGKLKFLFPKAGRLWGAAIGTALLANGLMIQLIVGYLALLIFEIRFNAQLLRDFSLYLTVGCVSALIVASFVILALELKDKLENS